MQKGHDKVALISFLYKQKLSYTFNGQQNTVTGLTTTKGI